MGQITFPEKKFNSHSVAHP